MMMSILARLWIGGLLAAAGGSSPAPVLHPGDPAAHGLGPEAADAIRQRMQAAVDDGTAQGVSVLVAQRGEIIFEHAVGTLTTDGQVQAASSAKPITAATALTLVERGRLKLDEPIDRYLPEFKGIALKGDDKEPAPCPTLRQILSNTGGQVGDFTERFLPSPFIPSLAEQVKGMAKGGLSYRPGTEFRYSTVGFNVAARVAEVAAGKPFDEYAREAIFEPLGMNKTEYVKFGPDLPRPAGQSRLLLAGGAMLTTPRDLGAFYQMLLNGGSYGSARVLKPETVALMIAPQTKVSANLMGPMGDRYGLALFLDRFAPDGKSPRAISHAGVLGTMPWADLDRDLVGVIVVKSTFAKTFSLVFELQRTVRSWPLTAPAASTK